MLNQNCAKQLQVLTIRAIIIQAMETIVMPEQPRK